MNDRPTIKQIATTDPVDDQLAKEVLLDDLRQYGYVIVHPDDVPLDVEQGSGSLYANAYGLGWNNCHRRIFESETQ